MIWKPNVTVAAVVERNGKFLLVEERTRAGPRLNQPAGHLEREESLREGVVRETLEETAYRFVPEAVVGVYRWPSPAVTYLRFTFSGRVTRRDPKRRLDHGILRTVWMTVDELRAAPERHRSPLVMRCIDDYLAGKRYPLELLTHYEA
ncbi:MAG TPA: NUDIX hydrolase [Burkholderiales bacterium]|nr:NUDIX hydrolase [Burkholderiales bacterium]